MITRIGHAVSAAPGSPLARLGRTAAVGAIVAALGACTTLPDDGEKLASGGFYFDVADAATPGEPHDPIEGVNRAIFSFNLFLDDILIRPVTVVYRAVVPDPAKQGIHNFLVNLDMPVTAVNALLQGKPERAGAALGRFVTNTVAGIGGIVDVAAAAGAEPFREDFGQTLAVYGAGPGPYLVLPVLGPSNVRDTTGRVVDIFLDPFSLAAFYSRDMRNFGYARAVTGGIDARHQIFDVFDDLRETSVDFYAALRSLYNQRREAEIRDGAPVNQEMDYFRDDPFREMDGEADENPTQPPPVTTAVPGAVKPVASLGWRGWDAKAPSMMLGEYSLAGAPSSASSLTEAADDSLVAVDYFEPFYEERGDDDLALGTTADSSEGTSPSPSLLDAPERAALGGAPAAEVQVAGIPTARQAYRLSSE